MKYEGWRNLVIEAVRKADRGQFEQLNLLASYLEEVDIAKQELRNRGYGCTGMGILETVRRETPGPSRTKIGGDDDAD